MKKAAKSVVALGLISVAAAIAAPTAMAEQGDWIIRGGATMVDPKSNNLRLGTLEGDTLTIENAVLNVDEGISFGFNITYMLTNNWGIELLAAVPFSHDVDLCFTLGGDRGCGKLAEVKHLPPTLSLQYHFRPDATIRPYVGAGINLTLFSDEKFSNQLQAALDDLGLGDASLKLDDSMGFAAQVGADFAIGEKWFINADVRYIQIDSDVTVRTGGTSASLGDIKIDPLVYSIMIGTRF